MSLRINNNVAALNTQRNLRNNTRSLRSSLEKLSSGFRINRAGDDPAGLIISERLRAQKTGLSQAIRNSQEASNIFGITESSLTEVNTLLTSIRQLAIHASNSGSTTKEQIVANQQEVDSAVASISRISEMTKFGSDVLLNGNREYLTDLSDPSLALSAVRIDRAALPTQPVNNGSTPRVPLDLNLNLISPARAASHRFATNAGTNFTANLLDEDIGFEVRGSLGSKRFDFQVGTSIVDIQKAVNNSSQETGVVMMPGRALSMNTRQQLPTMALGQQGDTFFQGGYMTNVDDGTGTGTNIEILNPILGTQGNFQVVDLDVQNRGTFDFFGDLGALAIQSLDTGSQTAVPADRGQDLVIALDGLQYISRDGKMVEVNNTNLVGELEFNEQWATNTGAAVVGQFSVVSGGMNFQLGEGIRRSEQSGFAFQSVDPGFPGRLSLNTNVLQDPADFYTSNREACLANIVSGRPDSLFENPKNAMAIIDKAIDDISSMRARMGAYQKGTLEANIRSLSVAVEEITATESSIRDADVAVESTEFTKNQILTQAATSVLAQANAASQNLLSLLQ